MLLRFLCVFVGGGAGSLCRYLVGIAVVHRFFSHHFPIGTLLVNLTGSFLIGVIMTLIVERLRLPHVWQLLLVVGFLGGYTTFSSFEYDLLLAARGGRFVLGGLYLLASVGAGYGAVCLGARLAQQ